MIAVDSSSLIAYFSGASGNDVAVIEWALEQKILTLPPAVLTEMLSDPKPASPFLAVLKEIPLLNVEMDYWERAGQLRSRMFLKGYRPGFSDTLIAQSCLDSEIPLITRDRDFQAFHRLAGLKLFRPEIPHR